jgi:hypothetical protein
MGPKTRAAEGRRQKYSQKPAAAKAAAIKYSQKYS